MTLKFESFLGEATGHCGHCGYNVSFDRAGSNRIAPKWSPTLSSPMAEGTILVASYVCTYCKGVTVLRLDVDGTFEKANVRSVKVLYPEPVTRRLDPAIPVKIRSLYEEAALCESNGAVRAAGVIYRAAVEEMCADLSATGNNLYERIEKLSGLGLDATVVEDMHEARMLGNDSIHQGLAYAPDEVADVADLIEEALVVLYVQPAQRAAYRQKRKARRDQARQTDGN